MIPLRLIIMLGAFRLICAPPPALAQDLPEIEKTFDEIISIAKVGLCPTRGEIVALVGPSGSGKSTLLSLIGGLDCPEGGGVGSIAVGNGSDLSQVPFRLALLDRSTMGSLRIQARIIGGGTWRTLARLTVREPIVVEHVNFESGDWEWRTQWTDANGKRSPWTSVMRMVKHERD